MTLPPDEFALFKDQIITYRMKPRELREFFIGRGYPMQTDTIYKASRVVLEEWKRHIVARAVPIKIDPLSLNNRQLTVAISVTTCNESLALRFVKQVAAALDGMEPKRKEGRR
jgi:hypothetical protein